MTENCARKDRILEIAEKLFNKLGYEDTSMRKIAEVVGSGKASLYYYFKSKEEIFLNIIEKEGTEYFKKHLINMQEDGNQLSKLRDCLMIPADFFEKHSSFIIKLFFNTQKIIASKPRHRVKEVEQKYYDVFKETLQKGIATGEIREDLEYERFMQIMFIIMHSMLFMYLPEDIQPINAEERVTNYELMLDIMIEGIRRK